MYVFSVQPVYSAADAEEKERPETKALLQAFSAWCGATGGSAGGDAWACRYIVRAAKRLPENGAFFQSVLGETIATSRIRIEEPHGFLRTVPGMIFQSTNGAPDMERGKQFRRKVLLRQRKVYQSMEEALSVITTLRNAGYLIAYELDDNPLLWEKSHGR